MFLSSLYLGYKNMVHTSASLSTDWNESDKVGNQGNKNVLCQNNFFLHIGDTESIGVCGYYHNSQ